MQHSSIFLMMSNTVRIIIIISSLSMLLSRNTLLVVVMCNSGSLLTVHLFIWLNEEPFKSIKENADQLQEFVDLYGITTEEQQLLPDNGMLHNCLFSK